MGNVSLTELFDTLSRNLDLFVSEVKKRKLSAKATDKWTVKGVLAHLVFWHENYAANYHALASNQIPVLLDEPCYKLNIDGVNSLKSFPVELLVERLNQANASLRESIIEKHVPQMTYKKNGRVYTTPDFLDMVARHVATHTRHIKRAK